MKKLHTFFYSLKNSLTNFSYYKDIRKVNFGFSLKYLATLLIFINFFYVLAFVLPMFFTLPNLPKNIDTFYQEVDVAYPQDLVMTYENQKLSINQPVPYFIDPDFFAGELRNTPDSQYQHFITIDTDATPDMFLDYKTGVLVTGNELIIPQNSSSVENYRVYPYKNTDVEDFVFTRENYDGLMVSLREMLNKVPVFAPFFLVGVIILLPIILSMGNLFWGLFYLLLLSIVVFIVSKVFKNNLSFGEVYRMGMHGLSWSIIIVSSLALLSIHIPYLYSAIFLLFMTITLSKVGKFEKKKEEKTV